MPLYINGVLSGERIVETKEGKSLTVATDSENYFGPFIASKTRPLFHRPNCKWMRRVSKGGRIRFASHALAVAAGRKPCKACKA
jgi:methylphosphotriester-DNA--protein-cysteine methyltransferase